MDTVVASWTSVNLPLGLFICVLLWKKCQSSEETPINPLDPHKASVDGTWQAESVLGDSKTKKIARRADTCLLADLTRPETYVHYQKSFKQTLDEGLRRQGLQLRSSNLVSCSCFARLRHVELGPFLEFEVGLQYEP